jgi:hypothetical protein
MIAAGCIGFRRLPDQSRDLNARILPNRRIARTRLACQRLIDQDRSRKQVPAADMERPLLSLDLLRICLGAFECRTPAGGLPPKRFGLSLVLRRPLPQPRARDARQ